MKSLTVGLVAAALLLLPGCDSDLYPYDPVGGTPAPPRALDGWYYNQTVNLYWELHSAWNGEPFRIYGKRVTDRDYFLVATVTNCVAGSCTYQDRNIAQGNVYEYYVAAVGASGIENPSDHAVQVTVPFYTPPPVPGGVDAIALDNAIYLTWDDRSRSASDFHFYRIYFRGSDGSNTLLGETDSEGFLDLLVENGNTYRYFVSAVDRDGHESDGSSLVEATPRPDYSGELLWAWEDVPELAGFRFRESETMNPILPGNSPDRHFRLEVDGAGWWLVPGPGVQVHRNAFATTALRCGPAADAGCTDLRVAPSGNYSGGDIGLAPGFSYVLRVPAGGGGWRYGVVRITHVGWAQDGALALFDWAFQLQSGNPALAPAEMLPRGASSP